MSRPNEEAHLVWAEDYHMCQPYLVKMIFLKPEMNVFYFNYFNILNVF